jgi:hypothetical protein
MGDRECKSPTRGFFKIIASFAIINTSTQTMDDVQGSQIHWHVRRVLINQEH